MTSALLDKVLREYEEKTGRDTSYWASIYGKSASQIYKYREDKSPVPHSFVILVIEITKDPRLLMLEQCEIPLTFKEAALYLDIKEGTLREKMRNGDIRFYRPAGKKVYFDPADRREYMR